MTAATSRPVPSATAAHPLLQKLLSGPIPAVMGVLNVTPDSFSDGGNFLAPEHALAQAKRLVAEGADIIDIGAESTRPYGGARPVGADEEMARLRPVLSEIIKLGVPVSIDSMKSDVAGFALDAGAVIANDVSGLQRDRAMASLLARLGGSIAAHLIAAKGGARIIRTHDVAETVQALKVASAIEDQG